MAVLPMIGDIASSRNYNLFYPLSDYNLFRPLRRVVRQVTVQSPHRGFCHFFSFCFSFFLFSFSERASEFNRREAMMVTVGKAGTRMETTTMKTAISLPSRQCRFSSVFPRRPRFFEASPEISLTEVWLIHSAILAYVLNTCGVM